MILAGMAGNVVPTHPGARSQSHSARLYGKSLVMNSKFEHSDLEPVVTHDLDAAPVTSKHHGRSILMLEDDDTLSEIFGTYLVSEGFTVVRVPSPRVSAIF